MKELRLVLLGLAAIIAVGLGAGFLMRAFTLGPYRRLAEAVPADAVPQEAGPGGAAPDPQRVAVERRIAAVPDYARFFDRLRTLFPDDYASILNAAVAGDADLVMSDAVIALRRAHGGLATKASDAALGQIFAFQLREVQALAQRDAHLCVSFLYGASGSGFLPFAAENRALIADTAIAGLDAMNSGRSDPVTRATPSDDDFQTLDRALVAKGLTRPEIDALLDGKTADPPIPDDAMCKAGQDYLQTLAAMPAAARGRLYGLAVDLMAKS